MESYRRLAERVLQRTVAQVQILDPRYVRGDAGPWILADVLAGATFTEARRRGKLLVLDVDGGARLGLRFGMTGRLLVDGDTGGVDRLVYASDRRCPDWDRFAVVFADGGTMVVHDPRLLGGVSLDPDEDALGPDALSISRAELAAALETSTVAVKARLLDQARVSGIGNLVADEVLWRAGIAPQRRSASLDAAELHRLHRTIGATLRLLMRRGGSHTGDLMPERRPGGRCPRDHGELRRATVGGRTSWWCPIHQH